MKVIALGLALILQLTGLWPHLSAHLRERLADAATTHLTPVPSAQAAAVTISQQALPVPQANTAPPSLEAGASILAIDRATATPLYQQAATKQRPIASVTKMITTLVVLARHDPSEIVTVGQLPNYGPEDDTIGLIPGEQYRLGDLIRAALIPSANDAADALAIYDSGSTSKFATQMNAKMATWGITGTHFSNPSGLQDADNYATAQALAKIASLALTNPFIAQAVRQPNVTFSSIKGRTLTASSTDDLLSTGRYYGIKTGYTLAAGECFVGLTRVAGHDVITVVLGANDRFGTTEQLVTWIGHTYQWL